jgi:glycosyltransferase involved in cell wall biosynthesis
MSDEREKIIHVPRRFAQDKWGGTESVIVNLCRQQQLRGYAPEIHTSKALNPTPHEMWQTLPVQRYGYVYPYFPLRQKDRETYDLKGGNLFSYSLYRALVKAKNVRIYHTHCLKRLGGEVLTAARKRGKPCVVTIHGNYFDVPEAERASFGGESEGPHIEWGKALGMFFNSRNLLTDADAIMCVGHSEYEAAKKQLPHDRVHYLPNGVNPGAFENGNRDEWRARLGFERNDFIFGCISRIDAQKGQHLMLHALQEVLKKHPNAAVVIAGPVTDPGYGREIEALRGEMGQRVRLLPSVDPESADHAGLLAALDAFVLPSRHEPFGIVVLEAWAAKKPVIVSRVGGLIRLTKDGVDALQIDSGRVEQLAACMERLMASPALCEHLTANGYEKMIHDFTWAKIYDHVEHIYAGCEERCAAMV